MKKLNVTVDQLLSAYYKEAAPIPQSSPAGVPSMLRIAAGLRSGFTDEERAAIRNSEWAQRMIATAWREAPPEIGYYIAFHRGDDTFRGAIERLAERRPREAARVLDAAELIADLWPPAEVPASYYGMAAGGGQTPWSYERKSGNLRLRLSTGDDPSDPLTVRVTSDDSADAGLLPRVLLEAKESGKWILLDKLPALTPQVPLGAKEAVTQSIWLSPETFREAMHDYSSHPFIATVWLESRDEEIPEA